MYAYETLVVKKTKDHFKNVEKYSGEHKGENRIVERNKNLEVYKFF